MVWVGAEVSGYLPEKQTKGASGYDLRANEDKVIPAGSGRVVGTGVKLSIPPGYEGQIRSRSGLAAKKHVFVLNSPGTIDSDYRGELKVILFNASDEDFKVFRGDRIAQLVFAEVHHPIFEVVPYLDDTDRGDGGLGSTGGYGV